MSFYILVDYDNLSDNDKSRDLLTTVEKIAHKLDSRQINETNIQVRLYGGWYENSNLTRQAQNLSTEIQKYFPATTVLSDNTTQVIVNVELAMSLTVQPKELLLNTFRRRGNVSGIRMINPVDKGCSNNNCPVARVHEFVEKGYCIQCRSVRKEDVFYKQEQKLVDTMLTSDMIEIGQSFNEFAVVTSDDDFWPGIFHSLMKGATVHHILTQTTTSPKHYLTKVKAKYTSQSLLK